MRSCAGKNFLHRCLHLGVDGIAEIAKGGGEFRRADKDAVHALDCADGVEIFQRPAANHGVGPKRCLDEKC